MKNLVLLTPLLFGSFLLACSEDDPAPGDGDGDMSSGGMTTGGAASGGTGGTPSGGASTGGTGAATSGGSSSGGVTGDGGAASGGSEPGSGGSDPGTGGTGGGEGAYSCPTGSESLTPTLQGKTPMQITGVPEIVNNGGFLEGPVWYDGKLFVSQLDFSGPPNGGSIFTYTPGSGFSPFVEDVGTNGLAITSDGRLLAASQLSAGIISFDADDGSAAPTDVARMYDGNPFNSPNDLTVRSDGTVYFTDPTHNCQQPCGQDTVHGVYRVPPGGQPELLTTSQDQPNGIALSPDEGTLYVGGTALTAHPVMADGSVGAGAPFGDLAPGDGTDGLGVDCAGHVYVTLHQTNKVVIFDSAGTRLAGELSITQPTNVAFGGAENKTLYVTSFGDNRGQLYSVEMEVPGYPY